MKFKAGDKVWAVCDNAEFNLHGTHPAVVVRSALPPRDILTTEPWYEIDLENHPSPPNSIRWISAQKYLFPRDEDGRQVGEWRNTVWKPQREEVLVGKFVTPQYANEDHRKAWEGSI